MIGYEDADIKLEIKDGIMWGTYKDGVIINKDVSIWNHTLENMLKLLCDMI